MSGSSRRTLYRFLSAAALVFAGLLSAHAQLPGAVADKEVTIYGNKIRYVEAGQPAGPVVILLHGLGGNSTNWAFTIPALTQKYRVLVPDQIGFGRSDKPLINYRIATYVDFLDAFYRELKVDRAALVGNSMGGWVAAAYALAHPERVDRLVLVDAAGYAPPARFDLAALYGLNPTTRAGMKELAALVFYDKKIYLSDPAIDFLLTQRLTAGDGYTIQRLVETIARREDVLDGKLSALKRPTLIVWGRDDGLLPLAEFGERFHKEIAGSELLVMEQCGHVPMVEKASEFNAALNKFLSKP